MTPSIEKGIHVIKCVIQIEVTACETKRSMYFSRSMIHASRYNDICLRMDAVELGTEKYRMYVSFKEDTVIDR
jgi:hypothetical protein